jgi:hypothetical protein
MMGRTTLPNNDALDAIAVAKTEIGAMLARTQERSADHFNADPDSVNWAEVVTLNHYRAKLFEVSDLAFSEGEHAL